MVTQASTIASTIGHSAGVGLGLVQRVPSLIRNNKPALEAVRTIAIEPSRRNEALLDLFRILLRKLIAPAVAEGLEAPQGFAKHLFESSAWTASGVDSVPHFGTLESLSALGVSRSDYALITLGELLNIKRKYAHLGLGSSNTGIRFGKSELTGLELLQTWSLLHNLGHLHGTFATERALLIHLHRSAGEQKAFFSGIDATLRSACLAHFDTGNSHHMHYVLAAWRVSQWPPNATRTAALACLRTHMDRDHAMTKRGLLVIYKRARQLAYGRMHQMVVPSQRDRLVRREVPDGLFSSLFLPHEHMEEGNDLMEALDNSDRVAHQALFASQRAAVLIAHHQREFDTWWSEASRTRPLESRINDLFTRPLDWPTDTSPLSHVVRLEVPVSPTGWSSDAVRFRTKLEGLGIDVVVHGVPDDRHLILDLFATSRLPPRAITAVARLLAQYAAASWSQASEDEANRRLWRTYAAFGAHVVGTTLAEGHRLVIRPEPTKSDTHFGYAILGPELGLVRDRLKLVATQIIDETRARELVACRDVLGNLAEATCLVFLGTTWIVDADGQSKKELDGLCILFRGDHIEVVCAEHKERAGGRAGQLTALQPLLVPPLGRPTDIEVTSGRCTVVTWNVL